MHVAELYDGAMRGSGVWRSARVIVLKPTGQNEASLSSDEQCRLVHAVATAQDRGAFATLFNHFAPRVKSFLMRSGLEEAVAEEVTQETKQRFADPDDEPQMPMSGEDIAIAADLERQVRLALGTLSHEQATIVRLSYFADKPHAEIARELGIPLGTVKSRIRLALGRLRTMLDSVR